MKKLLQIIILTLITACGSTKFKSDLIFEQKFKQCTDEKYDRLASLNYPFLDTLLYQKTNIHDLLENKLIMDGYLEEVSKKGYLKLMDKSIPPSFFEEFRNEIGFDPDLLFPINSFISCYGILYHRLNLYDKKSWQFKFGYAFNQYEAHGMTDLKSPYLKAALKEIPERKFKNIIYRKVFLDLLYTFYE